MSQTICITALEDGTFEVAPEGEAEPMGGEMGQADMAEDKAEGSIFASIDEALNAAKQMLSGGPAEEQAPMMDGEQEAVDSFSNGFQSVRGSPAEQMSQGRRA
jgi:hypothetical protein